MVDPDTPPTVALIDVDPALSVVASPAEPLRLLIEATAATDELQTAVVVRFWVVLSLYVPVAVNCSVTPLVTVGSLGVTVIDSSAGAEGAGDEPDPPPPPQSLSANRSTQQMAKTAGHRLVVRRGEPRWNTSGITSTAPTRRRPNAVT
jgi:hypothetical protein